MERTPPELRWRVRNIFGLAMAVILAACTPHPVGPARTFAKFEGKAVTTAEAALSSVETVRLAATTGTNGDAFGPYLSVLISGQEDSLAGVQGTFGSIQPPSEKADRLRAELDDLLSSALDHVADTRIAVRRGDITELADVAAPLAADAAALEAFIEQHRS
jgi:hypothetical protein